MEDIFIFIKYNGFSKVFRRESTGEIVQFLPMFINSDLKEPFYEGQRFTGVYFPTSPNGFWFINWHIEK